MVREKFDLSKIAPIDIAVLDFEACGLNDGTWPIEAGWIRWGDLAPRSILIRPHTSFGRDLWSMASQKIHGIDLATLDRDGVDIQTVYTALADELGACCVVSDNPTADSAWLDQLCRGCGKPAPFVIADLGEAIFRIAERFGVRPHVAVESFRKAALHSGQPPHRAGPDAARLMGMLHAVASSS
jgi:hypothetical protein